MASREPKRAVIQGQDEIKESATSIEEQVQAEAKSGFAGQDEWTDRHRTRALVTAARESDVHAKALCTTYARPRARELSSYPPPRWLNKNFARLRAQHCPDQIIQHVKADHNQLSRHARTAQLSHGKKNMKLFDGKNKKFFPLDKRG